MSLQICPSEGTFSLTTPPPRSLGSRFPSDPPSLLGNYQASSWSLCNWQSSAPIFRTPGKDLFQKPSAFGLPPVYSGLPRISGTCGFFCNPMDQTCSASYPGFWPVVGGLPLCKPPAYRIDPFPVEISGHPCFIALQ